MKPTKTLRRQLLPIDRTDIRGDVADHVTGGNGYIYAESLFVDTVRLLGW